MEYLVCRGLVSCLWTLLTQHFKCKSFLFNREGFDVSVGKCSHCCSVQDEGFQFCHKWFSGPSSHKIFLIDEKIKENSLVFQNETLVSWKIVEREACWPWRENNLVRSGNPSCTCWLLFCIGLIRVDKYGAPMLRTKWALKKKKIRTASVALRRAVIW